MAHIVLGSEEAVARSRRQCTEPFGQAGFASERCLRCKAFGVAPQCRGRRILCRSELDRMSDEPALETVPADLGMKLAGEHMTPEAECLVRADLGRGEKLGPLRQVEGVAMPM